MYFSEALVSINVRLCAVDEQGPVTTTGVNLKDCSHGGASRMWEEVAVCGTAERSLCGRRHLAKPSKLLLV